MSEIAIRIENLSKQYQLGVINTGAFFRDLQMHIARMRGLPNPHAKIGKEYCDDASYIWALKNVTLDIPQGSRIGIIGKNGAGKSTLLKMISQISSPTEGTIKIHGKVTSLLEVGTGFNGELTGRENIYLNGAILGMKKKQIDRRIDEIIDFSGIERHIDTPVKRYSSGMYVRLAFAVAAHLESDILIADEVLAVGDAAFQKKAVGKLSDVSSKQGRTVLFVSHQMNFISQLCSSCVIMDNGRVAFEGLTDEAIPRYLELGTGDAAELEYRNDTSKPISITRFSLVLPDGSRTSQYKIGQNIIAKIEYEVNEPIRAAYVAFHVFGPQEQYLIDSCDVDDSPDLFERRMPGKYEVFVTLPGAILNAGRFYVEAWTGIPSASTEFMKTERIAIDIYDTGSVTSRFNKTRQCLLSPMLKWETKQIGEPNNAF